MIALILCLVAFFALAFVENLRYSFNDSTAKPDIALVRIEQIVDPHGKINYVLAIRYAYDGEEDVLIMEDRYLQASIVTVKIYSLGSHGDYYRFLGWSASSDIEWTHEDKELPATSFTWPASMFMDDIRLFTPVIDMSSYVGESLLLKLTNKGAIWQRSGDI